MLEDMKVCSVEYNGNWENGSPNGDPHHEDSDWSKIQKVCSFTQSDSCEFIVYVGNDPESIEWALNKFKSVGLSKEFIHYCIAAIQAGYHYVSFYD